MFGSLLTQQICMSSDRVMLIGAVSTHRQIDTFVVYTVISTTSEESNHAHMYMHDTVHVHAI